MLRAVRASWRPFAVGALAGAVLAVWYYRDARAAEVLLGPGLVAAYLVDLLLDVTRPATPSWWAPLRTVFVIAGIGAVVALMLRVYPRSAVPVRSGPSPRAAHGTVHGSR